MSEAIKELQKALGIGADGVLGRGTLKAFMKYYHLSPEQTAHFFGQAAHESADFEQLVENLDYSKEGLLKIFGKYFTTATAEQYARKPEKIANKVYANRMGNGPETSGDGWKYRGRFCIGLTGKTNYYNFSVDQNDNIILSDPDKVLLKYAIIAGMFFFKTNLLWSQAKRPVDDESIKLITKRINGGYNGLADRITKTKKFYALLTR